MVRDDQANSHIILENRIGNFSDTQTQAKFGRNPVTVSLEKLAGTFSRVKFYDAKPESIEYVMDILWQHYFTQDLPTRALLRNGKQAEQRRIELPLATAFLRDRFVRFGSGGQGCPEVPDTEWVRAAMEEFVRIKRAQHDETTASVYWVDYSTRTRNTNLAGFARQVYKARNQPAGRRRRSPAPQLRLEV